MLTPQERTLRSRSGGHTSWANTTDRTARTEPARRKFNEKFLQQVDPDGLLAPAERARRAEHARKAYFASLALKSAQSRRRASELNAQADAADAQLAAEAGAATG